MATPSNGFTEQAQEALRHAQDIVQEKRHTQLDVEHILLALLVTSNFELHWFTK
jgi:ATP-dependent Clp protease ATP-binding subunit ClpA